MAGGWGAMRDNLIGLWHFDESGGALALNAVPGGAPMQVHGAVRQPGRFGAALFFRHRFEFARAPAVGALAAGTVSLWVKLGGSARKAVLLNIQEGLKLAVEPEPDAGLVVLFGEAKLASGRHLEPGRWYHVAVSFGPQGLRLLLDGQTAAADRQVRAPLPVGRGHEQFVCIGGAQAGFASCGIDELAIFDRVLSDGELAELASCPAEPAAVATPAPEPRTVAADRFIDRDEPTCGLQKAIAAVGPAGGMVAVPAGRYVLRRGLKLSSRITLAGEGGQTVLSAPRSFASPLASDLSEGAETVEVADASGFAVGDEIMLTSRQMRGWHSSHAVIAAIKGRRLELSRPLWKDYKVADGAIAVHWFAMITAVLEHGICLTDLTIEGVAERLELRPDFTASAIHLVRCFDCQVSGCRVRGWPHDGVSVQMGGRVRVTDCSVRDCCGHGLHPGTGTCQTLWANNIATNNGADGLFFCARVRDSIAAGNILAENGRHGIGGLGGSEDRRNLVSHNQCVANHCAGIEMDGGKSNTVVNNICRGNSRGQAGKWPGILLTKTRLNVVAGNQCLGGSDGRTQRVGILERTDAEANIIRDNICLGCELRLKGKQSCASGNLAYPDAQP